MPNSRKDSRKPLVSGKASGRMLVGTPDYMAPEMINSIDDNGQSIDWWAIGCIIYELIVGIPPFNASTKEEVWDNIRNRRLEWPPIGYGADCMTPEAQDLIDQLLQLDPANRLTDLDLIKKHAFFKGSCFLTIRHRLAEYSRHTAADGAKAEQSSLRQRFSSAAFTDIWHCACRH